MIKKETRIERTWVNQHSLQFILVDVCSADFVLFNNDTDWEDNWIEHIYDEIKKPRLTRFEYKR